MNITAQAQHAVIRMYDLGRTAHYRPVDYEYRMPSFVFTTQPKSFKNAISLRVALPRWLMAFFTS